MGGYNIFQINDCISLKFIFFAVELEAVQISW